MKPSALKGIVIIECNQIAYVKTIGGRSSR